MKKLLCILGCALCLVLPLKAQAFNLGGIEITLPGGGGGGNGGGGNGGGSAPAAQKQDAGLSDHPTKIEVTMNSPLGYDTHSKYTIKGKVTFADKPTMKVPEYTEVYLTPKSSYLEGNVFHGGYYGNGHTNSEGEFTVKAKPGDYVLLIFVKNYVCVAPATADMSGSSSVYAMSNVGSNLKFKK